MRGGTAVAGVAMAVVAAGTGVAQIDAAAGGGSGGAAPTMAAYLIDARASGERTRTRPHVGRVLRKVAHRLARAEHDIHPHERTAVRMDRWFACIQHLPVDQVGDIDHRWGFQYDERDGTGLDTRPALAIHEGRTRPDLVLLRRSRGPGCLSKAPDPNGTGADARVASPRAAHRLRTSRAAELRRLERRFERLERRIESVDSAFERFDEWESCLSWLPVTELGHDDQDLGYLFDLPRRSEERTDPAVTHVAAVDIDTSEWDDPDYELLAFLGRDRPFSDTECGNEPGEGVDRPIPSRGTTARRASAELRTDRGDRQTFLDRLDDLRRDVAGAVEDVEDLLEPVEEFVQFDECMYTVGMRERGSSVDGYRYVNAHGEPKHRAALSFDMRGFTSPQLDVMAFSGEEPPQIECNEDAGGQDTDE